MGRDTIKQMSMLIEGGKPFDLEKDITQQLRTTMTHKRDNSMEFGSSGNVPNTDLKALYKELSLFVHQLLDQKSIADLVEQNVFIPAGFNQNAI